MDMRGKTVFVGLSGGVDSGVTAALLKQQGANVTGVFIKGWYPPGMPCTWAADRRDAMRVAARLQIPFHTLDASDAYKAGVIDYLLKEYAEGRTPNPDVMCNREVKFGSFYEFAKERGADFIATGHYARIEHGDSEPRLMRGIDMAKDQSYFLWAVPTEALSMTVFPLGSQTKDTTRALARKFNLPNAQKRDSQGICFLGSISVEDFLKHELGCTPGEAQDVNGSVIGTHEGATLYTLGERVRLTAATAGPWYVIAKDMRRNTITVAHTPGTTHTPESISLTSTNWLQRVPVGTYSAQYRYHGPVIRGTLSQEDRTFAPDTLSEPLASGQSLVIYDGDTCIGGGIMR